MLVVISRGHFLQVLVPVCTVSFWSLKKPFGHFTQDPWTCSIPAGQSTALPEKSGRTPRIDDAKAASRAGEAWMWFTSTPRKGGGQAVRNRVWHNSLILSTFANYVHVFTFAGFSAALAHSPSSGCTLWTFVTDQSSWILIVGVHRTWSAVIRCALVFTRFTPTCGRRKLKGPTQCRSAHENAYSPRLKSQWCMQESTAGPPPPGLWAGTLAKVQSFSCRQTQCATSCLSSLVSEGLATKAKLMGYVNLLLAGLEQNGHALYT